MGNEIDALSQAIQYATGKMNWYDTYAFWKMIAFRTAGVVTILATVAITYLSASLSDKAQDFLGFKKQHLITGLAVLSAVAVALPTFFGWQKAWEGHRVAQFQIEAAIVEAKINQTALKGPQQQAERITEAQKLTKTVRDIVLSETDSFYRGIEKPAVEQQAGG